MGLLTDKIAFITGGARNIGLAIAERFCEEGAEVVIGDIDVKAGEQAKRHLAESGFSDVIFVELDVTDESSVEGALAAVLHAHGAVDILVNNAGIHFNRAVVDMGLEEWNRILEINLTGAMICSKVFAAQIVKQGRGGRVIFTSSQAGNRGYRYASGYCASKFGMIGLMECLALELAEQDITVNCVCPGNIDTEMWAGLVRQKSKLAGISEEAYRQREIDAIPMRRLGKPREVADAFVFLASPLASYISGETITVDGAELSG